MKTLKFPAFLALFLLFPLRPAAAQTVYANLGPLSLPVPWETTSALYIYNLTEHESQVGGEMSFLALKVASVQGHAITLNETVGAEINPNSNNVGSAFVGFHLTYDTTNPTLTALQILKPGVAGGYDINRHLWWVGLKSSFNLFRS